MNKQINYLIISVLFIIIIFMWYIIFSNNNISNKRADNVVNNIDENKIDEDLKNWKKNQIKNYKFVTDLEFWTWNIINIDLEAREVELELIPWIKSKMNTFNSWTLIEPLVIRAKKGDKIVVNFKNSLKQETTVHWHWVRVPNSQDWVPWLTQDAIPVWWTYNYTFVVNDPWTFLFHPHKNHSEQIWRWLYWVLIVEDDKEPKYDKEFIWVLKDFRLDQDWTLNDNFDNMMDKTHAWRLWNVLTINNIVWYKQKVNPWDTVRLRIANMSNARIYNIDFSKFDAKVIATDDSIINNTKKAYNIEMWPGERYDIELKIWDKLEDLVFFDNYFNDRPAKLATLNIKWENLNNKDIVTPVW